MSTYLFVPPTRGEVAWNPRMDKKGRDRNPIGYRLIEHFATPEMSVNVYLLTSGVITEVEPMDRTVIANYWLGGHESYLDSVADADGITALQAAGYTLTLVS